jgi:hypothetical protein
VPSPYRERLTNVRMVQADREKRARERDRIYEEVMRKGWNEKRCTFTDAPQGFFGMGSKVREATTFLSR